MSTRVNRKDLRSIVGDEKPGHGRVKYVKGPEHVVKNRKNFLGAYGSAERPGRAKVGDVVYVDER